MRNGLSHHLALFVRNGALQLLPLLIVEAAVAVSWHDGASLLPMSHVALVLDGDVV